jgi:hypothetical protein
MHQTAGRSLPESAFTLRQARELGITRGALEQLVASGEVMRVLHGVYWPASLADTLENRAHAVQLVMPTFAVICDQLAAWLHGVDTFDHRELEILPPVDVLSLRGHNRLRRRGCRGCTRELAPHDVTQLHGLTLTTELRTALDLGRKLPRRDALAALDAFMRLCGVHKADLIASLPRFAGRRGVRQLRELVAIADGRAESTGESWTRLAIHDAGIPAPTPQLWVEHHGRRLFRLDLGWLRSKVAVEYDGEQFHDSDEQRKHDRRRRMWLRDHGWTVIVVRKDSFSDATLHVWLAEVRAALRLG